MVLFSLLIKNNWAAGFEKYLHRNCISLLYHISANGSVHKWLLLFFGHFWPTYSNDFYPIMQACIMSNILRLFWTLPTLKSDLIYGRSLSMYVLLPINRISWRNFRCQPFQPFSLCKVDKAIKTFPREFSWIASETF